MTTDDKSREEPLINEFVRSEAAMLLGKVFRTKVNPPDDFHEIGTVEVCNARNVLAGLIATRNQQAEELKRICEANEALLLQSVTLGDEVEELEEKLLIADAVIEDFGDCPNCAERDKLKEERDTLSKTVASLREALDDCADLFERMDAISWQEDSEVDASTFSYVAETVYAALSAAPESERPTRPKVVCLCGSSKFPFSHFRVMMELTLAGNIVIPMGLYGHADFPEGSKAATNDGDESTQVKQALDELHFAKIALADEICVVSVGGYTGSSTKREIEHAKQLGKLVRFRDFSTEQAPASDCVRRSELDRLNNEIEAVQRIIRANLSDDVTSGSPPAECVAILASQRDNCENEIACLRANLAAAEANRDRMKDRLGKIQSLLDDLGRDFSTIFPFSANSNLLRKWASEGLGE